MAPIGYLLMWMILETIERNAVVLLTAYKDIDLTENIGKKLNT